MMLFVALDAVELLQDERFSTMEALMENRAALSDLVQEILITKDADAWLEIFNSMEVPVRKVATVEEAVRDAQALLNKMVVPPVDTDVDVPLILNHPVKVSGVAQVGPKRAPDLGEHSARILEELGYSAAEIEAFGEQGVI